MQATRADPYMQQSILEIKADVYRAFDAMTDSTSDTVTVQNIVSNIGPSAPMKDMLFLDESSFDTTDCKLDKQMRDREILIKVCATLLHASVRGAQFCWKQNWLDSMSEEVKLA